MLVNFHSLIFKLIYIRNRQKKIISCLLAQRKCIYQFLDVPQKHLNMIVNFHFLELAIFLQEQAKIIRFPVFWQNPKMVWKSPKRGENPQNGDSAALLQHSAALLHHSAALLQHTCSTLQHSCITLQHFVALLQHSATLLHHSCLLYTSPSPRDQRGSRMPSSA